MVVAEELGRTLAQYLYGYVGPITHREHLMWVVYYKERADRADPDRTRIRKAMEKSSKMTPEEKAKEIEATKRRWDRIKKDRAARPHQQQVRTQHD